MANLVSKYRQKVKYKTILEGHQNHSTVVAIYLKGVILRISTKKSESAGSLLHQLGLQKQKNLNASLLKTVRIIKSIPSPSDEKQFSNEETLTLFLS